MKTKIYNYKMVFGLIIGFITTLSIGVYAGYTFKSSDITYKPSNTNWNVTNVESALNDLYSNINVSDYTGTLNINPSFNDITLSTKDKILRSNITINAIPNTYKNLTTQTSATTSTILSGKTAYNQNGEIIYGTMEAGCVYGKTLVTSSCATTSGCTVFEGFNPSVFILSFPTIVKQMVYYNAEYSSSNVITYTNNSKGVESDISANFRIENDKLIGFGWDPNSNGHPLDYIVCQ